MSLFLKLWDGMMWAIGKIKCPFIGEQLPESIERRLLAMLAEDHFIILTRRRTHLSTYLISFGAWIMTGKFSEWTHTFVNIEGDNHGPVFAEAVYPSTRLSSFSDCFDVASFALLTPRDITQAEWTEILQKSVGLVGKPYDTLFDYVHPDKVNCVEMVRVALKTLPEYEKRFAKLEAMIAEHKTLTPQMLFDCGEFSVRILYRGRARP